MSTRNNANLNSFFHYRLLQSNSLTLCNMNCARLLFFSLLFLVISIRAQLPVGRDTITVIEAGKVLKLAWAGGLNSCMISQVDLDLDGKKDIVIFDKANYFAYGVFRCFLNKGNAGQINYVFDGKMSSKFPAVQQWAYFYDYNNDGKADLFTYTVGGIMVFKNTSTVGNLSFVLKKPLLYSKITASVSSNVYASPVSLPGFSDIDNDGDMDILTFSSTGYKIEYHRNVSENYNIDSLEYVLDEYTWGDISENTCAVALNQFSLVKPTDGGISPQHSGSCLMCFDRDGDGDKDLILGDIACNAMSYCENGGTITNAHIIDTTKLYPNYPAKANTNIIKMNNFPCTYNFDVDNDGKKDLVASPNVLGSENFTSVWYYRNVSSTNTVDFQFVKNNFLQDEMIELGEGAYPVLFDVDNDGLLDLIVANSGYYIINTLKTKMAYYHNIGTLSQPSFSLITRDYNNFSTTAPTNTLSTLIPTFGDIDGDGDNDMLIADYYGKIHWSENTAGSGNPCNFSIFHYNYYGISTINAAPYPQLIDVDRDSDLDLIIGTRNGKIAYYKNIGTASVANFTLITNSFGNIDVTGDPTLYGTDGSCAPFMFDVAGSYKLLCGSVSGNIFYYDNIDGNLGGTFNKLDSVVNKLYDGPNSALQYVDINGDSKRDLILGNYGGGLTFFSSKNTIGISEIENTISDVLVYPNPAYDHLEIKSSNKYIERTEVTMMDMFGKTILTQSATSNALTVSCSGIAPRRLFIKDQYVFFGEPTADHFQKNNTAVMRKPLYIVFFPFIIVFSFCKKDTGPGFFKDYPNEVGNIIINKCATSGCHNDASYLAAAGLNLSTWEDLFKGSNSGSSVIPYRADFSSFCYFINTFSELGPVNYPTMPYNAKALSKDEVTIIQDWINNGAPNKDGVIKWADNPSRKKVYVVNQGCDVVTVFDSETQLPMRYITVGNDPNKIEVPHIIKFSPDGLYWYVVFVANNILQKFSCVDDRLISTIVLDPTSNDWNTIIISDDSKRAYCVAWASNGRVASVDLEKMKVIQKLALAPFPHGVALNGSQDTLYITGQTGNFIFKLDTGFNISPQISIQPGFLPNGGSNSLNPHELLLSPDKSKFYITCEWSNEVRVFNIATNSVVAVIPNIYNAKEMAISVPKNKLYVSCMDDTTSFANQHGCIAEIDLTTYAVQKIKVGFMPHGLGIDENKNLLYVASRNIYSNGPAPHHTSVCGGRNGFINYIDLNTLSVLSKRTEIAADPYSVGIRK